MQAIHQILLDEAVSVVKQAWPQAQPQLGIVLGSGWGGAIEDFTVRASLPYEKIPNLGKPSITGHAGQLLHAKYKGKELFIFQGRRHLYEGEGWTPVVLPIWILKQFDGSAVLLTNASGGIRNDLRVGALMAMEDHINMLGANPLIGSYNPAFGERFPDQTEIYDPSLRQRLIAAGADSSGIYLATTGPTFETPAEVRAFRSMGADTVGMSTVPEAIFGHAINLNIAGLTCVCNRAAGLDKRSPNKLTHEDVTRAAEEALPRMRKVLTRFIETLM